MFGILLKHFSLHSLWNEKNEKHRFQGTEYVCGIRLYINQNGVDTHLISFVRTAKRCKWQHSTESSIGQTGNWILDLWLINKYELEQVIQLFQTSVFSTVSGDKNNTHLMGLQWRRVDGLLHFAKDLVWGMLDKYVDFEEDNNDGTVVSCIELTVISH